MKKPSCAEENYLKKIYQLSEQNEQLITTNTLAAALRTSPAAVTDMVQRLHRKGLIVYQKYQGVSISSLGRSQAIQVLRKHRLWEVFLVEKLKFVWDEVEEVAEQLEHIQSWLLVQRLDDFLGNPTYSPHGAPIPDVKGEMKGKNQVALSHLEEGMRGIVIAVKEHNPLFLQYLSKRGIYLGAQVSVIEKIAFDQSIDVSIDGHPKVNISRQASNKICLTP